MSAHVLVVPSKLYARVKPDGSFRLEGVPAGARTLVAWSPSLKPVQQKVDVDGNDTARVAFEMEYTDQKSPHEQDGPAVRLIQRVSGEGNHNTWPAS